MKNIVGEEKQKNPEDEWKRIEGSDEEVPDVVNSDDEND